MKKILTIAMVMALTVASVFAAETFSTYTSSITLNADVRPVAPVFEIYASTSSDFATSAKGTETLTVGNPATDDIKVYFRLAQTNIARYEQIFDVTVKAAKFAGTFNSTAVESANTPVAAEDFTLTGHEVVSVTEVTPNSDKYTAKLTYAEKKAVNPIDNVLTMTYTWTKDEALPATTYKSSISIEIKVAE